MIVISRVKITRKWILGVCVLGLGGFQSNTALAQVEESGLEEIVVTAQQREQRVQDVPVAMSAYTGESLEEMGTVRPGDLMSVTPGLSGRNVGGAFVAYAIRGITSNVTTIDAEASVGVFVDGMYVGRFGGAAGAMYDLERVEVLKGPQSTMFGRNSSAGVINIVANKPTSEFSVDGALRYGERNSREAELALNLPVSDSLALRIAGRVSDEDGWANYAITGDSGFDQNSNAGDPAFDDNSKAVRLSARYEPSDGVTIDFTTDWEDSQLDSPQFPADSSFPTGPFDELTYISVEDTHDFQSWGLGTRISVDLANDFELVSFTGYREFDFVEPFDLDGLPQVAFQQKFFTGNETFFQDFRLHRTTASTDWFLGASYWKESAYSEGHLVFNEVHFYDTPSIGVPLCAVLAGALPNDCFDGLQREDFLQDGDTETFAIYGDVIFAVTDRLSVSVGARFSREKKTIRNEFTGLQNSGAPLPTFGQIIGGATDSGPFTKTIVVETLSETFDSVQPRFAVDYQVNDNHMVYGSIGRGFKSGGFNTPLVSEERRRFQEETSWSYEFGLKSTPFDGRVAWNSAVYYYEYEDYQDRTRLAPEVTPFVANAASVVGFGIETDLTARLSDSNELVLTGDWKSIEFDKYDDQITVGGGFEDVSFAGNRLAYTPEYSVSLGLRNVAEIGSVGDLTSFILYAYNGDVFFNRENMEGESGYGLLSARLTFQPTDANWSIGAYGTNILDEEYLTTKGVAAVGVVSAKVGRPRTLGVEFKIGF